MRTWTLVLVSLLGCKKEEPEVVPWVPPGCGDAVLDEGEQCDEGEANSDTVADACRSSCLLPACGDGVQDSGEACDDGGLLGGDGCAPACTLEEGQLEVEPNDEPAAANAWEGQAIFGSLDEDDRDCFSLALADCEALAATIAAPCPDPVTLRLHDPAGSEVAVGTTGPDTCAALDPLEHEGARYVTEGTWSLCVEGLLGRAVPGYELELSVVAAEDADFPMDEIDDPDDDGLPSRCDDDRDGDGVLDVDDNCPDTPNGGAVDLGTDSSGFIRSWLAVGPFTGHSSPDTCLPSDAQLVAEDDSQVRPALGDVVVVEAEDTGSPEETLAWRVLWSDSARIEFLDDFGEVAAPREVYLAVYLYSEEARTLTLALGPDDGAYAWVGGVEALAISGCQGTNTDQFQAEVSLEAGWTPLVLKVYDQGGGWGTFARFFDSEGAPVNDLQLSLSPDGPWVDNQEDTDGDGTGDACDDTPAG